MNQISYFIRAGCRWLKVTTSVSQWARLPHVVGTLVCKATGLLLLAGLTGSMPGAMPVGGLSAGSVQPSAPRQVAAAPSSTPADDAGAFVSPVPAASDASRNETGRGSNASLAAGDLGTSFFYPPVGNDTGSRNDVSGFDDAAEGAPSGRGTAAVRLAMTPPEARSTPQAPIKMADTTMPAASPPVIIPEPGSLPLLGMAILVLAGGRRAARRNTKRAES